MDNTLEFGDTTWEESKGTAISTLRAHDKTLYGNGKPGLVEEVSDLKTEIAVIKGYGQASAFWGRLSTALIGLGLTAIAIILSTTHH